MSQLHPLDRIDTESDSRADAAPALSAAATLPSYFQLVGQVEDQVRFADSEGRFPRHDSYPAGRAARV